VHELAVFVIELLEELKRGQILLGDRAFGTYACLALLIGRGVDGVFRLHQARRVVGTEVKLTRLDDRRVRWSKSKKGPFTSVPRSMPNCLQSCFCARFAFA